MAITSGLYYFPPIIITNVLMNLRVYYVLAIIYSTIMYLKRKF